MNSIKCKYCEKEFIPKSYRNVYCSAKCKYSFARLDKVLYSVKCAGCGVLFTTKTSRKLKPRKYCSVSCQLSNTVPVKTCICVDCGASFEFVGRTKKLRCDECHRKNASKATMKSKLKRLPLTRIGIGSGGGQYSKDSKMSELTRAAINAKRREKYRLNKYYRYTSKTSLWCKLKKLTDSCSICGYNLNKDALVIHHLDMNRTNNNVDNLVVICSNCHSIIHQRIKRLLRLKLIVDIKGVYSNWKAEVKERNKAGTADGQTRTEGFEGSESGATHSSTSRTDMSYQEAVQE